LILSINDVEKNNVLNYIVSHPKSYISPYILQFYIDNRTPVQNLQTIFNGFDSNIKRSQFGRNVEKSIAKLKDNNEKPKSEITEGKQAPDILVLDEKGKEISLNSLFGKKYLLLNFWASWCLPCIEHAPHIKEIYKKYNKRGLEIVNISFDRDTDSWKQAMERYNFNNYKNVFDKSGKNSKENYNIIMLPSYIILDKTGKIIAHYTGLNNSSERPELDLKLAEIFK